MSLLSPERVTYVLPNALVRYAVVPWSDGVGSPEEEEAYVRHHFARIHGERAKAWVVRASPERRGRPRLCSAVDRETIESVKKSFTGKKTRLVSIQPALMAAFNRVRKHIPREGAWLVLAEEGRACIALYSDGWRSVQNARGSWQDLLVRERHRAPAHQPSRVMEIAV